MTNNDYECIMINCHQLYNYNYKDGFDTNTKYIMLSGIVITLMTNQVMNKIKMLILQVSTLIKHNPNPIKLETKTYQII